MQRRFLIAAVAALGLATSADAGGPFRSRTRSVAVTRAVATSTASGPVTAEAKSQAQAASGVMRHVGPVPSGCVEGVGFSTAGPEHALSMCCYSNSGLPLVSEAVVRGARGWYATRIFAASRAVVAAPANVFRVLTGRGATCVNGDCGK